MDYQKAAEAYLQTLDDTEKDEWWCTDRQAATNYVREFATSLRADTVPVPPDLLSALERLFDAYCSAMRSEFDFPSSPWTPERDNDEDALMAQAVLAKYRNQETDQ